MYCVFLALSICKLNPCLKSFQTRPCFQLVFLWVSKPIHLTRMRCSGWVRAAWIINEFEKSISYSKWRSLSRVLHCVLKLINYHAALTQPEHRILVRWMGLETQRKTSWKHGRVWKDFKHGFFVWKVWDFCYGFSGARTFRGLRETSLWPIDVLSANQ